LPGVVVAVAVPLLGGNYCESVRLDLVAADCEQIVARRFPPSDVGGSSRLAELLLSLADTSVPAPTLVGVHDDVVLLEWVDGAVSVTDLAPDAEADALGGVLAVIHALPVVMATHLPAFPLLPSPRWQTRIRETAAGAAALLRLLELPTTTPGFALIHGDFFGGNVLWADGDVAAVIDWDRASRGSPTVDVASCGLDLLLRHGDAARSTFYDSYFGARDRPDDLAFWELRSATSASVGMGRPLWESYEAMRPSSLEPMVLEQRLSEELDRLVT